MANGARDRFNYSLFYLIFQVSPHPADLVFAKQFSALRVFRMTAVMRAQRHLRAYGEQPRSQTMPGGKSRQYALSRTSFHFSCLNWHATVHVWKPICMLDGTIISAYLLITTPTPLSCRNCSNDKHL